MSSKNEKSDTARPRGGRLARRARSFKEDFFGRITQMRSPSGTRSGSPSKTLYSKSRNKGAANDSEQESSNTGPGKDVDCILHHVRQLANALRYFQDVVEKNTLEMLPGSASVVLETVLAIHSVLRKYLVNEQSTLLLSATNQVYQSLANLIRWSDNVLLYNDKAPNKETVQDIVRNVQEAIKTLVQLCVDRLQNKEPKLTQNTQNIQNGIYSTKNESSHRNSLPDIPLTPREREILEQTNFSGIGKNSYPHSQLHHSTSSDSILSSGNKGPVNCELPPPKPPLPTLRDITFSLSVDSPGTNRSISEPAPPLPPKKRVTTVQYKTENQSVFSFGGSNCPNIISTNGKFLGTDLNHSCLSEWGASPLSHSSDSSTPLSKSLTSSLDSNLNHSADDILSVGKIQNVFHKSRSQADASSCEYEFVTSSQTYSYEYSSFSSKATSHNYSGNMDSVLQKLNHVNTSIEKSVNSNASCLDFSINNSPSVPPALPIKQRPTRHRTLSQYDNIPHLVLDVTDSCDKNKLKSEFSLDGMHSPHCPRAHSPQPLLHHPSWIAGNHSPSCPHHTFTTEFQTCEDGKPPPLPPKKKNIMAYMQMFGSYSQPAESEFYRHSLHTYQVMQAQWQQVELSFMQQHSFTTSVISSSEDSVFSDDPSSRSSLDRSIGEDDHVSPATTPPALPPKKNRTSAGIALPEKSPDSPVTPTVSSGFGNTLSPSVDESQLSSEGDISIGWTSQKNDSHKEEEETAEQTILDELDVTGLIYKNPGEDGPEIRGGHLDSLIIQATKASKNDFIYQEAFLTTYRTFITPIELIHKLLYRYNKFIHMSDMRQRAARNAFALLVRVVDDLCVGDADEEVLQVLMDFIFQLVSRGDLVLARALRKKVVEKCEIRQRVMTALPVLLPSMAITTHQASLLDFKSETLAEQMTLLDADLFQKIEIPEVLLWAKEQKEELSPNLTTFTEHFNKMSYWARSRILEPEEAKERERYVVKFIKIMKYLRKLNNFNSYLSILSALDSAPIRRLEWQRNITEGLKEYCALIDSSSSFRAYRQALADTEPPCIPYIGLILQDLTFVHIGNNDFLPEGAINFSKHWQQFNILENMKRFKNCQYPFKRNEQIISFFNNFDNYLCEESMWQISESIKPRGGKKKDV